MNTGLIIGFVLFFVIVSLVITWVTSKSNKTAADFYVAGKHVPWMQVGIAMIGSYLSAASFLGCAGDIGVFGIDSIWLSIGFFGGYMAVLLLIASPLRNIGAYTVAGSIFKRYPDNRIKTAIMLCTIVISTFYLVPQLLGAGLLFEMLLGWNFVWVTIGLGVLMSTYIIFGGMKATLYNQVIQALFLFGTMLVITVMAFFAFGNGSFSGIFDSAEKAVPPIIAAKHVEVVKAVTVLPAQEAMTVAREMLPNEPTAMTIGVKSSDTLAMMSTVIALVFGTAGLPHILIMFFTVPSARAAKKSVALCITGLGIFYLCAIFLGFMLYPAIYPKIVYWISQGSSGVGFAKNMAVLEISQILGGSWLMAIGAAGAVAAILSTAAGLMIAVASSISHDLYKVYINPNATEKQELMIAKVSTLAMSAVAIALAVLLRSENIAWLVMLAFSIAASAITPALLATLWFRRASRLGIIMSIYSGLLVSIVFIVMLLAGVKNDPIFGLPTSGGPGLFGILVSTIMLIIGSWLHSDKGHQSEHFLAVAHKPDKT